jgi:hypothetical protein
MKIKLVVFLVCHLLLPYFSAGAVDTVEFFELTEGLVNDSGLRVRSEPTAKSEIRGVLNKGDKVEISQITFDAEELEIEPGLIVSAPLVEDKKWCASSSKQVRS